MLVIRYAFRAGNRTFGTDGWALKAGGVKLTAAISREGGRFVARCLEAEVASQGETVEESQTNLQEALELLYEDQPLAHGLQPAIVSTIETKP